MTLAIRQGLGCLRLGLVFNLRQGSWSFQVLAGGGPRNGLRHAKEVGPLAGLGCAINSEGAEEASARLTRRDFLLLAPCYRLSPSLVDRQGYLVLMESWSWELASVASPFCDFQKSWSVVSKLQISVFVLGLGVVSISQSSTFSVRQGLIGIFLEASCCVLNPGVTLATWFCMGLAVRQDSARAWIWSMGSSSNIGIGPAQGVDVSRLLAKPG
ncbi:Hypothetical predicted protein, partial [Prunus dulcis]